MIFECKIIKNKHLNRGESDHWYPIQVIRKSRIFSWNTAVMETDWNNLSEKVQFNLCFYSFRLKKAITKYQNHCWYPRHNRTNQNISWEPKRSNKNTNKSGMKHFTDVILNRGGKRKKKAWPWVTSWSGKMIQNDTKRGQSESFSEIQTIFFIPNWTGRGGKLGNRPARLGFFLQVGMQLNFNDIWSLLLDGNFNCIAF